MTTKIKGWTNRQKDIGWGYSFAHCIPGVWIYYAITRRTLTPFVFTFGGATLLGFVLGFFSGIFIPNVDEKTFEKTYYISSIIATPFLAKKGINYARKEGQEKLDKEQD